MLPSKTVKILHETAQTGANKYNLFTHCFPDREIGVNINLIYMITINTVFDHRNRTQRGKPGAIEIRITHNRRPQYISTGIR